VRDRLVHHALYRTLYPYFDRHFIHDSYSCRIDKGTHRSIRRFREFGRKVSRNHTKTCWVLKGDIRKFFASINHSTLRTILTNHIADEDTLWLLNRVIDSFSVPGSLSKGLPLGNLTSQLLVNIYMNEFDQFVKRTLKIKYYQRYADDFVILSEDKSSLEELVPKLTEFLENRLQLFLHPGKFFIKTLSSGVDFLGWVHFPYHLVPRTSTRKRMFRNLQKNQKPQSVTSYIGLLSHGDTYKLSLQVLARLRN
jgi:RNA-directed DNA polymerase